MTPNEVEARVLEIVARQTGRPVDQVTVDSTADGLGLDSVGLLECLFTLEEEFGLTFPVGTDVTANLTTVGAMVQAVAGLIDRLA